MLVSSCVIQKAPITNIAWSKVAQLKNRDGRISLGFAGAINAVTNNVLVVAGGANFPEQMPWDGGRKYYSKEIHILQKFGDVFSWDAAVSRTLPVAIAYCGYTSTEFGIVYAGGENEAGLSKSAFLLQWNPDAHEVEVKPLPDLPVALTNIGLSHLNNVVYAVGGDQQSNSSNKVFSLDLNNQSPQWKKLPDMPVALANSLVIAQQGKLYVIGGRTKTASGISDLQSSTYVYDPAKESWSNLAPISDSKSFSNFSAGTGLAIGEDYILVTGGDNGEVFHQIETLIAQIAKTASAEEKAQLMAKKNALSIHHKGFDRDVLLYHIKKNQWTTIGELPFPAPVTTSAALWEGRIVLSNGEVSPGVRTPNVMLGKINEK
ncbi:cyclically-permuted mutarotase family protein [Pedobacter sp. CAN_A7]|uniref:galactose oxidase n=1 Tax=Pedobacter sp. CAN_A7 TaxID=2787722 RepID=UPI0018CB216F